MALRSALKRFGRARSGLAALEFALTAPLMIVLLITSIELINALQTNRRVENTAVSLSDVVSRDTEISNAELSGLWSAVTPLMYPDPSVGIDIRLTSISIDSGGAGRVVWSEQCAITTNGNCGGGTFSDLSDNSLIPANELPASNTPNSSLIRVEIVYDYTPILGFFYVDGDREMRKESGVIALRHTSYRRSRLVDPIPRVS